MTLSKSWLNKTVFTILSLCAINCDSFGQTDSTKIATQVLRIEQALADVLPIDSAFWSSYLDPHWHIVDEDGNVSSKKDFLASFRPWPKDISIHAAVTKPVFAFYGDIAVIQYIADEYETAYGQKLHTTYGTMDVWYKTDTSWKMLSMQDFEIPAWPPSIKVSPQILEQYMGNYLLSDEHTAIVSLKNDTLFLEKKGRKPEALFPETENVFFHKSEARGRKLFLRNEQGKMQMLERRNGQDLIWKRIDN